MRKYYVTMTDKFMSGWGMAQGRINKLVIECETIEQAQQIEIAAHRRSEMRRINLCLHKPRYDESTTLTTIKHWNDLGPVWTQA